MGCGCGNAGKGMLTGECRLGNTDGEMQTVECRRGNSEVQGTYTRYKISKIAQEEEIFPESWEKKNRN